MKNNICLLLYVFICSISSGQTLQKDSITQLEEVILRDFAKTKNATGITPSDVITKEVFQGYSPIDMVSSINQISGVLIFSGALNTNRITIRGIGARTPFSTDKLRMYYNNIPITNGTGSSTIEAFDLENLNAIEVVKGPKATSFGSNLGGAILLKPNEAILNTTTLSNSLTVGSYNLIKDNVSFNHKDEKLALGFQYGHLETDGYRENNSFNRNGFLLNTSYQFNQKNSIALLVNYIDYTAQIPSSLNETDYNENPQKAAFTWNAAKGYEANKYTLIGISYSHEFNKKLKNTSSLFYTYLDHYEPRPFNILDEFSNGYGFRSTFSGNLNSAEYTFGGELYKDEYNWGTFENLYEENNGNGSLQGNRLSNNKEYRRHFSAFGTFLYPFSEAFSAQAGLNINKTHYDFRDLYNSGSQNKNAKRSFDVIALPSLTLSYKNINGPSFYGNISRGFSNPSLEETLTPDGVINPDIAQETGVNYELGSKLRMFKKKVNVGLTVYQMDIKNLLVAQRVGDDQYIGKNAGKTKHQGIELDLDITVKAFKTFTMKRFFNYTFSDHRFIDFVDGENDFSGNPITGVPKHRIVTGMQIKHDRGLFAGMTYTHMGIIPLNDANTLSTDTYNLINAKVGYSKQLTSRFKLETQFGINNFFNVHYARSILINATGFGGSLPRYYYPGNNRNFYGGLQLKYQL
ncbi:iron complex outermembrane receptor protein [Saonia flava]|uniref:Iron complex outermembrane receptor protein n=1 Tax=Saonia flava TaxID=523696 RepID=A0A846R1G6_9FLAO|nr:TonB-dependent receptor [Saonia flava]NJB71224.1 iron complex outermembrane receptor protein [Saonia flava]